jgi:SAM-dependent methyltransferase
MRALVGPTEESAFDNPSGDPVYPNLPAERVLDFGCGCGRVARRMIQQREQPERYLGIDLHRGMIEWCRENLAPHAPQFRFEHHDVYNPGFNPHAAPYFQTLPAEDSSFSLVVAISVFTHVLQDEVPRYLREVSRVLEPGGAFIGTWFTFERGDFPMLQEFQHALYINLQDPTNAVIFDRPWIRAMAAEAGLVMTKITPPPIRGYHWQVEMRHAESGAVEAEWPPDDALPSAAPPPEAPREAHKIGLLDRLRRG